MPIPIYGMAIGVSMNKKTTFSFKEKQLHMKKTTCKASRFEVPCFDNTHFDYLMLPVLRNTTKPIVKKRRLSELAK
jgi:hypothetical protein